MKKLIYILLTLFLLISCADKVDSRLKDLFSRGCKYLDNGDAVSALDYFHRIVDETDTTKKDVDYMLMSKTYGKMGEIFAMQELNDERISAMQSASHYAWLAGDTLSALCFEMNEAQSYADLHNYDKSLKLAKKVQSLFREYKINDYADFSNGCIGVMHLSRGEYKDAKTCLDNYYSEIIRKKRLSKFDADSASYFIFMALYYDAISMSDSAIISFKHALSSGDRAEKTMVDGYGGLSMIYKAKQEIDSAYKYQDLYIKSIDTYTAKMKSDKVMQMASLYNYTTHKRNAEKASLDTLNYKLIVALLLIVASVVVAAFMFIRHNMRKHLEQVSREKNEAEVTLNLINKSKGHQELRETEIHNRLCEYIKNPVRSDDIEQEEWIEFQNTMEQIHPTIHAALNNSSILSEKEYRVCLLTKAGFKPSDITLLLSLSSGEVSHIKVRLLKKIFDVTGKTSDFNTKIAQI